MSETPTEEHEVLLEPGDPGYVEPDVPTGPVPPAEPDIEPAHPTVPPPGEDLTEYPEKGETEAEFMQRTRAVPVVSQSPVDIVPNRPHISFGPPPELVDEDQPEAPQEPVQGQPEAEAEPVPPEQAPA